MEKDAYSYLINSLCCICSAMTTHIDIQSMVYFSKAIRLACESFLIYSILHLYIQKFCLPFEKQTSYNILNGT